jgi:methylmalonyl-CoA mutase N-terminal domain/subunit
MKEENPIPIQGIDESLERRQTERLQALRERRDPKLCSSGLSQVEDAARSGTNLMPHIIAAVEAYATVGEISDTLRRVFGEYKEAVVI